MNAATAPEKRFAGAHGDGRTRTVTPPGRGLVARGIVAAPPGAATPVLDGVSLEVAPGEWLAIDGPNGCGKTTLALVLAGLAPVRAGRVEWQGAPLAPGTPRGHVSVVLQEPSTQLFRATVRDEIRMGALHLGHPADRIERALGRLVGALGLGEDLERDPMALSAGRQQVVLLAAALATGPDLLVADEATAHLDRDAAERVARLLEEECRRGLAIAWVTQEEAERRRAHRILSLGGPEAAAAATPGAGGWVASGVGPHPGAEDSPTIARVRVTPAAGTAGPRVRTGHPLEIRVPRRGLLGLTGPNGAGKSVLLHCVAGVLEAGGVRVERTPEPGPGAMLVGQYPEEQLFEERVGDELVHAAVQRGVPAAEALERAVQLVEKFGFDASDLLARRTWTLSSGEKRLVATAAALAAPGSPLLLDEPTAGLDPLRRLALGALLQTRAAVGAVVVASQDTEWLATSGCRVVRIGEDTPGNATSPSKKTD